MGDLKVGTVVDLGLIPCKVCGERHANTYLGKGYYSWMMDNHSYQEKDPRDYIQEQRDEINRLLKTIRRLKSKIHKLEKAK